MTQEQRRRFAAAVTTNANLWQVWAMTVLLLAFVGYHAPQQLMVLAMKGAQVGLGLLAGFHADHQFFVRVLRLPHDPYRCVALMGVCVLGIQLGV